MQQLSTANQTLSDEVERRHYDAAYPAVHKRSPGNDAGDIFLSKIRKRKSGHSRELKNRPTEQGHRGTEEKCIVGVTQGKVRQMVENINELNKIEVKGKKKRN